MSFGITRKQYFLTWNIFDPKIGNSFSFKTLGFIIMAGHCQHILVLEAAFFVVPASAQLSTLTLPFQIILGLLIFMFSVPIICKVLHLIRVQVNKIRNANLFGSNADPEYAEDDDDDD